MKAWIKGGLWGIGIFILLYIVTSTPLAGSDYKEFFYLPLQYALIALLIFFIIGAVIGLIIGKVKEKKI